MFRTAAGLVEDDVIVVIIQEQCKKLMTSNLPLVGGLFARELRVDLKDRDVGACIVRYYSDFD